MNTYSIQAVYSKLMGEQPTVAWDGVVWNPLNAPKHRFIL